MTSLAYEQTMKRAITLALKGTGFVSPNPMVGAVIIKNGEVIAEGWHHKFGGKHAEIDAIDNAQDVDLHDSTIVINLEPCTHHGKAKSPPRA